MASVRFICIGFYLFVCFSWDSATHLPREGVALLSLPLVRFSQLQPLRLKGPHTCLLADDSDCLAPQGVWLGFMTQPLGAFVTEWDTHFTF